MLSLVLEDAMKVAGTIEPATIRQTLSVLTGVIMALPFGEWRDVLITETSTCRLRLQRASHVQGAAFIEFELRDEGRRPLSFRQLISIDNRQQHQQVVNYLNSTGRPAIVIAGNGMCSGGRIVNYLKAMLGDPRHEVVFTGFQAKGSPGAVIQASEGTQGFVRVDLDGEMREIKAKVVSIGGYSAHADQGELLRFVEGIPVWPAELLLVQGGACGKVRVGSSTGTACRGARCGYESRSPSGALTCRVRGGCLPAWRQSRETEVHDGCR